MNVYLKNSELPSLNHAVITIGTFDGVHKGHQIILKRLSEIAKKINGESVLITFDPHPRQIIHSGKPDIKLITSLDEKLTLLDKFGVDHVQVVPFNRAFSLMSATSYVEDFIVGQWHPKVIVIGYDHKFGQNRSGDIELLKRLSKDFNFDIVEIEKQLVNEITVSSTKVRNDLFDGNVEEARLLLGHPFMLSGRVTKGKQLGQQLGFPTANIELSEPNKLIPGSGVFIVQVRHDDKQYYGMLNIGYRPTLSGAYKTIEVHILDFDKMIYGERLTLELIKKLREEQKFNNLDELKEQLEIDQQAVRQYFKHTT